MAWWNRIEKPPLAVVATLFLVGVLVLLCLLKLWSFRSGFAQEVDNLNPKTARLLGFVESEEELKTAAYAVEGVLDELVYSSEVDLATTEAALQKQVRGVMSAARLSVSSSQILPTRADESLERLNLEISVTGDIEALDGALESLRGLRPVVLVESITIKPLRIRASRGSKRSADPSVDPRKLSARLRLQSLRLQSR